MNRQFLKLFVFSGLFFMAAVLQVQAQVPVSGFKDSSIVSTKVDTFCSGTTVIFKDTSTNSPNGWSWNFNFSGNANVTEIPASGTSTTQNNNIIFTNNTATIQIINVTLVASNSSGSSVNTATKNIYILPPPPTAVISATPPTICQDSSIAFNSSLSTGNILTWNWNFGTGTPTTSQSSGTIKDTFTLNNPTNVTLTVTNLCGSSSQTFPVVVSTIPSANFVVPAGPNCNHTPINFTDLSNPSSGSVGGVNKWLWTFKNAMPATSALQNPVDSYLVAGIDSVTLIAYNACGASVPYSTTITIQNCAKPVAAFTTATDTVCMNSAVQFFNASTNGPNSLSWSFFPASPPYDTSSQSNPITYFNAAGNYVVKLIATNAVGSSTYTQNIYVQSCLPPVAAFNSSINVCQKSCTTFSNRSTGAPFDTIRWIFKGGHPDTSSLLNPPTVCYDTVGTYSIKLILVNHYRFNSVSHFQNDTLIKFITVLPAPRISARDTCIYAGDSVKLTAHGNGLITWQPSTYLFSPTGDTVLCTPINKITYTVTDTTTCPSPDSVVVCVLYKNVYITASNTFTPDGNGKNDIFKINVNIPVNEYNLKIYNRWGEKVFETSDYHAGWDGTYRGAQQNSGVYVWIIGYRDLGDNQYKFANGNVTLIR